MCICVCVKLMELCSAYSLGFYFFPLILRYLTFFKSILLMVTNSHIYFYLFKNIFYYNTVMSSFVHIYLLRLNISLRHILKNEVSVLSATSIAFLPPS